MKNYRIQQYEKAIQELHETKMKHVSATYSGMITELALMAVMCTALAILVFI